MAKKPEDELQAIEEEMEEIAAETIEEQLDAKEDVGLNVDEQGYGSPDESTAENVHTFLKRAIFDVPETFKVSNLKQQELGQPQLPVRLWLNLGLSFSARGEEELSSYCKLKAGIISDTSLSRDGFALRTAVTTKKEIVRTRHKIPDERR